MSRSNQNREYVWKDGALVAVNEALVSILDPAVQFGLGLFETMRLYGGIPHMRDRHLDRLAVSAGILGLPAPDRDRIGAAISDVATANDTSDGRLKVLHTEQTTIVLIESLTDEEVSGAPMTIRRATSWFAPGPVRPRPKSINYLTELRERKMAESAGYDEAVFCTEAGTVAEGTFTSVFARIGKMLVTPPESTGILPGITRERTIELARASGIAVGEQEITWHDLEEADEVFLTSSVREIRAVRSVGGREKKITPGSDSYAGELKRLYSAEVPDPTL